MIYGISNGYLMAFLGIYPLRNVYIAMENPPIFFMVKSTISIAMFNSKL